jgi:hypothetical protein
MWTRAIGLAEKNHKMFSVCNCRKIMWQLYKSTGPIILVISAGKSPIICLELRIPSACKFGPHRKHHLQQFSFSYWWGCIRCRGNVFTEPLPINGRLFWLHYSSFHAIKGGHTESKVISQASFYRFQSKKCRLNNHRLTENVPQAVNLN